MESLEKSRFGVDTVPFVEMATVGRSDDPNFSVRVHPERGRNDSYLKYYNNKSYEKSTHVIRLAFTKLEYYDHKEKGKKLWEIDSKERKALVKFLKDKPKIPEYSRFDTNWNLTIFLWNSECGFTDHPDYDNSFPEGCDPSSDLYKHPQFVPLNTEMPDYNAIRF